MDLSIVSTLYRSAPYLDEFHRRVSSCAVQLATDYEIVLVDDGSPDDALAIALTLRERDPRVRVIELARNFGQHKAIMTGLRFARGKRVFLLDCDLEEAPELLPQFCRVMETTGADVIYGVQKSRKGSWFERISGDLFYRGFRWLSDCPVPANLITARLMTRNYVRALIRHRDREVFLAGLWAITGFRQVPVEVTKGSKGTSSYDLPRKLGVLVNAITSFSNRPLVGIFHLGCLILAVSGGAGLTLLVRRIFFEEYLAGWPSLIISVWFLGGLGLFCQGILAVYLAKVFAETKRRPYTVIRAIHGSAQGGHYDGTRRRHRRSDRGVLHRQAPHARADAQGGGLELDRVPAAPVRPTSEALRPDHDGHDS